MIEKKVFFKTLDHVKDFVSLAATKNYDIELLSGKYVVNGKSIMGVLSLDLTVPITVVANTAQDPELENLLELFSVQPATV